MPVSPELAEGLARSTVDRYAELERELLALLADRLGRGLDSPRWAEQKLASVRETLAAARQLVAGLDADTAGTVRAAVAEAWDRGGSSALVDLAQLGAGAGRPKLLDNRRAVDRLTGETLDVLRPAQARILRAVEDAYRFVIAAVAPSVSAGVSTRRQATARALDRFAQAGIRAFTDSAGRTWEMATYAEMAVRTAAGRAAVDGHVERLAERGIRLVYVSDSPQECELCRPWEGKVLSVGAGDVDQAATDVAGPGVVDARDVLSGRTVSVQTAGTLAAARLAGLQHPNCRHRVAAYLPGATRLPTDTEDPEGDAARQRLRALERHVREWRRREAVAITDADRARAGRYARAWQAEIRRHVDSTPAKRRPDRERITGRDGNPDRIATERELAQLGEQLIPDRDRSPAIGAEDRDLSVLSDDELAELLADPAVADDPERLDAVVAELESRDQQAAGDPEPAPVDLSAALRRPYWQLTDAEREAVDRHYAEQAEADRLALAAGVAEREAHPERRGQSTAEQRRRTDYDLWLHGQVLAAEDATRGNMVSPAGQRRGITSAELFQGSAEQAIRYASEELIRWWEEDPGRRMGYQQWRAQATGSSSAQARRSRDVWLKALSRWEDVKRGRR